MLHIIYRTYGGENKKGRPPYYSKILSLMSFLQAVERVDTKDIEVIYVIDGDMPPDRLQAMRASGELLRYTALGLQGSMKTAFSLPADRGWPADDVVWFAEDDYLYQPHALVDLIAATKAFPEADYFGLYALIGSRKPDGGPAEDYLRIPKRWSGSDALLVNGHPWRHALSTTGTFGARVKAHAGDRAMMEYVIRFGGASDHATSLMYQGFSPHSFRSLKASFLDKNASSGWLRRSAIMGMRAWLNVYSAIRMRGGAGARLLVAPDPALITHLETVYIAAGTDWDLVAQRTREWMTHRAEALNAQPLTSHIQDHQG